MWAFRKAAFSSVWEKQLKGSPHTHPPSPGQPSMWSNHSNPHTALMCSSFKLLFKLLNTYISETCSLFVKIKLIKDLSLNWTTRKVFSISKIKWRGWQSTLTGAWSVQRAPPPVVPIPVYTWTSTQMLGPMSPGLTLMKIGRSRPLPVSKWCGFCCPMFRQVGAVGLCF